LPTAFQFLFQDIIQKLRFKVLTKRVVFLIFFLCATSACAPGRRPIPPGYIPPAREVSIQDEQLGHEILGQLSQKYPLDYDHPRRAEVDEIVLKLTDAIGASSQPWHVNVFTDPSLKNAAATKGNHIFIWTGMIDTTRNKDELAAILAHEVGHILARHTEPSNQEIWTKVLVEGLSLAAGIGVVIASKGAHGSDVAADLATTLTRAAGTGIFINPYSRDKEYEADQIGIYLMEKAGYRPEAALDFWERALNDPSFSASIPFLSTHPPAADRLSRLRSLVLLMKSDTMNAIHPYPFPNTKPSPVIPYNTRKKPLPIPSSESITPSKNPLGTNDSFDIRKRD
jgi:predicted Zn-dependent protease